MRGSCRLSLGANQAQLIVPMADPREFASFDVPSLDYTPAGSVAFEALGSVAGLSKVTARYSTTFDPRYKGLEIQGELHRRVDLIIVPSMRKGPKLV